MSLWKRLTISLGLTALSMVVGLGASLAVFITRNEPERFDNIRDHFMYGSFAGEARNGIPLLATDLPMFESCGRLYTKGLPGCSDGD